MVFLKLALIADIHANLPAFEKVLGKIKTLKVDEIICSGDVVGYNPFPNECISLVKQNNVQCILGNHDHACITGDASSFNDFATAGVEWTRKQLANESKRFLNTLNTTIRKNVDGHSLLFVHGSPRDHLNEYTESRWPKKDLLELFNHAGNADTLILGHTHIPMDLRLPNGKRIINPGAVGQPRDKNPKASFSVLDTKKMKLNNYRVSYDIDSVAEKIRSVGLPEHLAKRLYEGR